MMLLYTAATPFSPISWLTSGLDGALLCDCLSAVALPFAAIYFQ
jgi:hypothetical protein